MLLNIERNYDISVPFVVGVWDVEDLKIIVNFNE